MTQPQFKNGTSPDTYIGYRVMLYDPKIEMAISGYDKSQSIPLKKGYVVDYGKGHYLGDSVEFVMGYYGGMGDDMVLIKAEFDKNDVLEGQLDNLANDGGEIIVRKSTILEWKTFRDPDLEENNTMKFDKRYKQIMEMLAGDAYGGSEGSEGGFDSDWYAPGDARVPKVLGATKKKKKKKKTDGDYSQPEDVPAVQRRTFPNS